MKISRFKILLVSLLLQMPLHSASAQTFLDLASLSPYTHYKTFDTEHFHFIYQDGYFDFTSRAAVHLEHAHEILSPILKWKPRGRTDILIADNEDDANGFTMPALRVGIVLIATPPDSYFSTTYSDDWIKLLVFHEYTHFLNIDASTEWVDALRIFFGDVIKPNGLWPVWMLEGLAVYYETRTSKLGRGRSPYYDAIVRSFLNEGRLGTSENRGVTLERIGGDYPYFPGGEVPYVFGYHLWDQFSKDHSLSTSSDTDERMGEVSIRSSARVPFFLEGNLQNVMKKNWNDYWDAFITDSKTRLGAQIEAVKKEKETPAQFLTHSQYSSFLGAISPDGNWIAYTESKLDDRTRLVVQNLKTKELRKLDEKVLGVGMSFTPDSRYLIFSSLRKSDTYSLFSDLFSYDLKNDHTEQLTFGQRAKDPTLSADGQTVVFIQSELATHVLKTAKVSLTEKGPTIGTVNTLFKPSQFSILGTPKFLDAYQVAFSIQEIGKPQSDLMTATLDGKPAQVLLADGHFNRFPSRSKNGIEFTSDHTGIDNIYELTNGGKIERRTNVITSAQFPLTAPNGDLYASVLTSDGFEIASLTPSNSGESFSKERIARPSAPESLPKALEPPSVKIDPASVHDYSPWGSLAPRQWAPVSYLTYGQDAGTSIGGTILGFDSTGKQQYFGLFGYNFKPKTYDASFAYTLYTFRPIIDLELNTVTTDIADDLHASQYRKTSDVLLGFTYPINWTFSSLRPRIYGFTEWNGVYNISNGSRVATGDFEYANPMVPGLGASISFTDSRGTRLGFMPEMGNDVLLATEDRINLNHYSVIKLLTTYKHYFDLGNHSVLVPGAKFMSSTYPSGLDRSYSRLQGRNSDDITDRGTRFNLNRLGFRGYSNFDRLSRQVAVGSLDFHFPINTIFSTLGGTTPLFLKQTHGFLFTESAVRPSSRAKTLYLPSFGGGLTIDTTLFIRVPVKFNLEVQNGTRKDYGGDTSVFFSIESGSLF